MDTCLDILKLSIDLNVDDKGGGLILCSGPARYRGIILKLDYVQLCETQILNFKAIGLKNMN